MSVTSTMLPLGTQAPAFSLPDTVSGKIITLDTFSDKKVLLVVFMCRHCPYVQHVKGELAKIAAIYQPKGLGIVGISANDIAVYPTDAPASLAEFEREEKFGFPLCFDESQEVAKAYTAACTPDVFLFDGGRKLVYRGQVDASRPGNDVPLTGKDIRAAIDAVLAGAPVNPDQYPSSGCSIKWKPGNEPPYAK